MNSIVILYDDDDFKFSSEKVFANKCAKDLCMDFAHSINKDNVFVIKNCSNQEELLTKMCELSKNNKADLIVFGFIDMPFYNKKLTEELINHHIEYKSEYTFADGYSTGFAPEIIDFGTLNILQNLIKNYPEKESKITKDFIFELIKKDINSFEIETILSKIDFRLYRVCFDCEYKENFVACKEFFNELHNKNIDLLNTDVDDLNTIAVNTLNVLKTVPGFYNIQIADNYTDKCIYCPYSTEYQKKYGSSCTKATNIMQEKDFSILIKKINDFSDTAVIGLSLWGEAFTNPNILNFIKQILSYPGLSVFIETQINSLSKEIIYELKTIVENAPQRKSKWQSLMIAVQVDATTNQTFQKINGTDSTLEQRLLLIKDLEEALPNCIYPQFTRMNQNEEELEEFFRTRTQFNNNFIIQKYDDYCGLLKDEKVADLSPLERNICWHLRREMNILTNGDVILCKEYVLDNVIGNAFTQNLEEIWKKQDKIVLEQMAQKYPDKCEKCDEYYSYNF